LGDEPIAHPTCHFEADSVIDIGVVLINNGRPGASVINCGFMTVMRDDVLAKKVTREAVCIGEEPKVETVEHRITGDTVIATPPASKVDRGDVLDDEVVGNLALEAEFTDDLRADGEPLEVGGLGPARITFNRRGEEAMGSAVSGSRSVGYQTCKNDAGD
jgi:hypothetical protein